MLAISLLGVTPGLEVATFGKFPLQLEDDWVGISTSEIVLPRGQSMYYVSRRMVDGVILTWIGHYRHALCLGGSRGGGYYGAGVWLLDKTASGDAIVRLLPQLSDQVSKLAMADGQFVKKIAHIRDQIQWPDEDGNKLNQSMQDIVAGTGLGAAELPRAFLDMSSPDRAQHVGWFIDWAQLGLSFHGFSRLMISADAEVAASVCHAGRLKVLSPYALLAQENEQYVLASTQLAGANTEISEAGRKYAELKTEKDALQHKVSQFESVLEHRRAKEAQLSTDLQKITGELNQLKKERNNVKPSMQAASPHFRPQTESVRYPVSLPLHGDSYQNGKSAPGQTAISARLAQGGEADLNRRIKESEFQIQDLQRQISKLKSEDENSQKRIESLEDENDQLYQRIRDSEKQQEESKRTRKIADRTLLMKIRFVVAVLVVIAVICGLLWMSNRESRQANTTDQASSECATSSLLQSGDRLTVEIRQAIALGEAAKIVQARMCREKNKQCAGMDTAAIAAALKESAPVNSMASVESLSGGSRLAIRLPAGCVAEKLDDPRMALSPQADQVKPANVLRPEISIIAFPH